MRSCRASALIAACALIGCVASRAIALPPALGSAWTSDGFGQTAVFRFASAPFPHPSRGYTDDRVMVFVPDGFRAGPTVDVIVQYHGHWTEIVESDRVHRYREQLWLSKKNAVLLEPQGPVRANDSSGGKHDEPLGLARFLDEALATLVRERVVAPGTALGTVLLSGHSGAYRVIARALDVGGVAVSEVHLHDALYGELDRFEAWARASGHKLVSTFTRLGGTVATNEQLRLRLVSDGVNVTTLDDDDALASAQASFIATPVAHDDVTSFRSRWARTLEASALADLGVPQPRLRSVRAVGGALTVTWYPVRSASLAGYRLYESDGTGAFALALDERTLDASATIATLPRTGARAFRIVAIDDRGAESAPSCAYAASAGAARVLVVDGFSRTSGSWRARSHGFGALVARSVAATARACDGCSAEAVRDGSVRLSDYGHVVWLAGDQSVHDGALDAREESALASYARDGGTLCVSGSELGYTLAPAGASSADRAFYANVLRATFEGDSDPTRAANGVAGSALAGIALRFGGASAAHPVPSPDFFEATNGARVMLRYQDGRGAAVVSEGTFGGVARSGVIYFGFPLESIDAPGARDALIARVLDWADGVNRRAGR